MALSEHTKQCLRNGLASSAASSELTTIINAGTGAVSQPNKEALCASVGNHSKGYLLATKFSANTALAATTNDIWRLAVACGSYAAALEIKTEQAT